MGMPLGIAFGTCDAQRLAGLLKVPFTSLQLPTLSYFSPYLLNLPARILLVHNS